MARRRTQQPENSKRPAAAADQTPQQQQGAADPKELLLKIGDKQVTVLPQEESSPEELAEAERQLKEAQKRFAELFSNSPAAKALKQQQRLIDSMNLPALESIMNSARQLMELNSPFTSLVSAANLIDNAAIDALKNVILQGVTASFFTEERLNAFSQQLQAAHELVEQIRELQPYIEKELSKPEYEGMTFDELIKTTDADQTADSLFSKVLEAARAARDAEAVKEEIPHATITKARTIEYPLDKPNQIIWNLLEKDTKGQVTFNMAKNGSRKQILTYYSINFDGLSDIQITKRLLPFDKRVYIAVSALFNAGNNVITLSQIYYAMGYTGRPGTTDLEKINDAITKMTTARIYFDNQQEAEKYKYIHFKYDGSLLPLERGTVIVNGQLADAAIKIFREPPLITFAKQRQQITTFDVKLLQSPISKTDANLSIEDYLIERISREKNRKGAHSCRILFKTLYVHAGIADKPKTNTEKQQKKRAPEKIKKYLTYYQEQEFISRFTTEADGITVYW